MSCVHHFRVTSSDYPLIGTYYFMHHFRGVSLALSHAGMRHIMHHIRGSLHKFYAWFNVPVTWAYLEGRILLLCTIYVVYSFCVISCSCFSDVPITWCIIFLFLTIAHSFDVPHSWCTNYTLLLFLWLFRYHLRGAFLWLSGNKISFSLTSLGPTFVVHLDSISCMCLFQMSHLRGAYLRIFNYFPLSWLDLFVMWCTILRLWDL